MSSIKEHSGSKYMRTVHSAVSRHDAVQVDVYSVLKAFNVTCPATAHAIKKLLCAGLRGKGDREKDLSEAIDAIQRALEMGKQDLTVREDTIQESDAGGSGALRDGYVNYP